MMKITTAHYDQANYEFLVYGASHDQLQAFSKKLGCDCGAWEIHAAITDHVLFHKQNNVPVLPHEVDVQ